jgi:hypothetical protein
VSGESVAGVGVAAGVGAVALLGMAAGASCAFIVGNGLQALGSSMERRQAERDAIRVAIAEWDHVLRDVAVRNSRISLLQAAMAEPGHAGAAQDVQIPPPLVLGAQTIAELRQWCADTDASLAAAEDGVARRSAQAILRRAADLAGLTGIRTDFQAPDDDPAATADGRPAPRPGEAMREGIVRLARRMVPGVSSAEREAISRAAERVLSASSRIDARNRLDDLRARIDQANQAADGRRAQATAAARLLQPLARADASVQPLREELLGVVAGEAPLTSALRERARQAAAGLQRAADRQYVRDSVTESLAELGYAVDEGFQTVVVKDGLLQVTRGEWDAHGVRLMLDDEKQELRAAVVRTQDSTGWDANRVDSEREAQWCAVQEKLKVMLAARNISYEVRSLSPPGSRRVPVIRGNPAGTTAATPNARPRVGPA